ncbi:ATP synthase F1 subunit gamma [Pseudobacteriovorax antillogorgiicola]|uniref:ATP synthase gamma chain n=1 Tax=Pseudobacteriovorax antillogorgiicola TaxID=1513793 RepID=A0A1Y6B941_9BACT|nr:ATP synthase F1 subunit gamma [Pseudobacteriovorax antillogorgiicola]TCS59157.1 ATP synthase F1 subcomplex gamma subunit [Pseudobacteriovorax antillogorgiicola]SME91122.1 ATP synthase F1 subcomplex gamma subunit [Pseudobacteriovorax antillogorgiicola]
MANLKDIKRRIGSVKSTQKITNAMKLVSAAKFARANAAVEASRPYAEAFKGMVSRLIASEGANLNSELLKQKSEKRVLLVLLATDRGLCGGLNTNLFKEAQTFIELKESEGVDVDLFACGRRAISFTKRMRNRTVGTREKVLEKPTIELAREMTAGWLDGFKDSTYESVYVLFPKFNSALDQAPTVEKILPLVMDTQSADQEAGEGDLIVEPSLHEFLDSLLEKKLLGSVYNAFLNGCASEHGARMTAMDSATSNAQEVIKKLTLQYNRARQAAITTELTEIISGAEALN